MPREQGTGNLEKTPQGILFLLLSFLRLPVAGEDGSFRHSEVVMMITTNGFPCPACGGKDAELLRVESLFGLPSRLRLYCVACEEIWWVSLGEK